MLLFMNGGPDLITHEVPCDATTQAASPEPAGELSCPVTEAMQLLQERWTLPIVRTLLEGPLGFNELGRRVGNCNPATLSRRLAHLEQLGLVSRTVESVMPPRTRYELTADGVALDTVVAAIDTWARRVLGPRGGLRAVVPAG